MSTKKQYHIVLRRGQTFRRTFTRKVNGAVVNLTGYHARSTIRRGYGGAEVLTLTDTAGLTLGGAGGTVGYLLTDEQTLAFDDAAAPLKWVWDLMLYSPAGEAIPYPGGPFTVLPTATVPAGT